MQVPNPSRAEWAKILQRHMDLTMKHVNRTITPEELKELEKSAEKLKHLIKPTQVRTENRKMTNVNKFITLNENLAEKEIGKITGTSNAKPAEGKQSDPFTGTETEGNSKVVKPEAEKKEPFNELKKLIAGLK